ncbi:MAG: hypothetical protein PF694_08640 [Bacteroidetes bacterium]|jgi:hypothetical protein|nr:hypothetical protein [Bacteroidota bacterium]
MKKIAVVFTFVFMLALLASSCKSSSKCAAYGESHKFQRETRY